jgi:[protein-PII] uridylyltransferase
MIRHPGGAVSLLAKMSYAVNNSFLASAGQADNFTMNPIALAVDDLREQYLREMALVRQTCERTGDGTAAIRRRSAVVDRILIEMWRRAFTGLPQLNVALLALGGYGRKDLFPYSDIDVLFTFADEKTEEQSREAVRAIIQGMWDIGLRASPASRTVKEAGRFEAENLEFTLATLDRR